ncbi:Ribosomal RNA processing protein 1 B [Mactra antiquata]
MTSLPVEIQFAQNLAGNEKKKRDKALKKLRKYLKAKSSPGKGGFTYEDFLKIWKGLHYCMWMQDKPLLQEDLSTTLSQLVHDLSTIESQLLFIQVFFITIAREWNSIDVWRLDKFLMLVRNFLNESFVVIKKLKWDSVHLYQLTQIFYENVLNPDIDSIPDGLRIHFADIYLDEIEKVSDKKLGDQPLLTCLIPFIRYLQRTKNHVMKRVMKGVFNPVIDCAVESQRIKQGKKETTDDEIKVPYMSLKFDYQRISDYIFDVSQQDCVLPRNRPLLYSVVKRLQDVMKGVLPETDNIEVNEGVSNQDVHLAVNRLMAIDCKKSGKKKRKKKNNDGNNNECDDDNDDDDDGDDVTEYSETMINKPTISSMMVGGKRKHSNIDDNNTLTKIKKRKESTDGDIKDGNNKNKKKKKMNVRNVVHTENELPNITDNTMNATLATDKNNMKKIEHTTENMDSKYKNKVPNETKSPSIQIEVEIPGSFNKKTEPNINGSVTRNVKSGKRRRSESDVTALKSAGELIQDKCKASSKVEANTAVSNTSNSTITNNEGEIEIWVPNKKYKGNQDSNRRSSFAVFDNTTPPVAFVKRAHGKLKQSPSAMKKASVSKSSKSSKRVSFDLKKNQAQAFKDSLKRPVTPFNPTVRPDQGILKTPSPNIVNSSSQAEILSGATIDVHRTPITRQAKRQAMSTDRGSMRTHVVSVGMMAKRSTLTKRMKAADFFI